MNLHLLQAYRRKRVARFLTSTIHIQKTITIAELLSYPEEYFLQEVYQALLYRFPDSVGLEHYQKRLSAQKITRLEVILDLRLSPEGRSIARKIPGLKPFDIARRIRRFLGTTLSLPFLFLGSLRLPSHIRKNTPLRQWLSPK